MILQEYAFPIHGSIRITLIILEWLIVFLALELALIFLVKVRTGKKEIRTLQEKAYFYFFFGYSIAWTFYIIGDYYAATIFIRTFLINLGYFTLIICLLVFVYIVETYKFFLKKYFFTVIFLLLNIIFVFLFIFAVDYTNIALHFLWIMFGFFFVAFYLKGLASGYYTKEGLKSFKFEFFKFCIGFLLLVVGYQLTTKMTIGTFGIIIRPFGDILQLIGLVVLSWFLLVIPSFSEYDWQDKINSVYITNKGGLFLYRKIFKVKGEEIDEHFIAGSITIIKMVLQEITLEDETSIIEKEGKIIIIQPGKFVNGIIICDEKLASLQILLEKFVEKVENIYKNIFYTWDGDINIFRPLDDIAKEFFF